MPNADSGYLKIALNKKKKYKNNYVICVYAIVYTGNNMYLLF